MHTVPMLRPGLIALRLLERSLNAMQRCALERGRVPTRAAHLVAGEQGEVAALFELRRNSYAIVARRWKNIRQRGDLDLVAWEGNALCFVEVKTRGDREGPSAESAVDEDKRQVLRRLGSLYLKLVEPPPESVRFDVVTVYPDGCHLYRGVFGW